MQNTTAIARERHFVCNITIYHPHTTAFSFERKTTYICDDNTTARRAARQHAFWKGFYLQKDCQVYSFVSLPLIISPASSL